jgi:hypothetical protein
VPYVILFSSSFGLSWVMPRQVVDLFACWWIGGSTPSVAVWKIVHSYLLWCLWRERNDRSFVDCERTLVELKSFFFHFFLSFSADLWHLVLNIFGISWVMPINILELLHCWNFQGRGSPQRGHLTTYSCFLIVEHLERKELASL